MAKVGKMQAAANAAWAKMQAGAKMIEYCDAMGRPAYWMESADGSSAPMDKKAAYMMPYAKMVRVASESSRNKSVWVAR